MSSGSLQELRVAFETEEELRAVFESELVVGALFVPTSREFPVGAAVEVRLGLSFVGEELSIEGKVIGVLPDAMAQAGATPGLSLLLDERGETLRKRLEQAARLSLKTTEEQYESRRTADRCATAAAVVLEANGRSFAAETVEISYSGMLALLNGIDLGVASEIEVRLIHPSSGESIALAGRVANQTRCDHGVMAVGIQFHYALDQADQVAGFIDELNGFQRAKRLARVSGSLAETPLEVILETFSGISNAGTLKIVCATDEGRIAYAGGQIVIATTGLVSGAKAVCRMFTWRDAHFEFDPEVALPDGPLEPLPLESVILTAAIERDEIAQLDLQGIDVDTTFELNADLFEKLKSGLDGVRLELAENAAMEFPLGVILDMLQWTDGAIYQALVDLVESGVLTV